MFVVPARAGTHKHGGLKLGESWSKKPIGSSYNSTTRRMGPRVRGDDGER